MWYIINLWDAKGTNGGGTRWCYDYCRGKYYVLMLMCDMIILMILMVLMIRLKGQLLINLIHMLIAETSRMFHLTHLTFNDKAKTCVSDNAVRKETNGVGTSRATADVVFVLAVVFGYSREPTFISQKVPGRTFFHNLSKSITFVQRPHQRWPHLSATKVQYHIKVIVAGLVVTKVCVEVLLLICAGFSVTYVGPALLWPLQVRPALRSTQMVREVWFYYYEYDYH